MNIEVNVTFGDMKAGNRMVMGESAAEIAASRATRCDCVYLSDNKFLISQGNERFVYVKVDDRAARRIEKSLHKSTVKPFTFWLDLEPKDEECRLLSSESKGLNFPAGEIYPHPA